MTNFVESSNYLPRITLNGKKQASKDNAQIGFMYDNIGTGLMLVGNSNRLSIGNNAKVGTEIKNAIAIGGGLEAANNTVLIGGMSDTIVKAGTAVAIGYNINAGDKSVTIGSNANTLGASGTPGLVAIGESSIATSNAVAIGYADANNGGIAIDGKDENNKTNASGGVAIGRNAQARGIAIGHGTNSKGGIAIGYGAVSETNCDSIGSNVACEADTVTMGGQKK